MKIEGIYKKTVFRNVKNGYTIFDIENPDTGIVRQRCVGFIPIYTAHIPLELNGEMQETKWGKTFQVKTSRLFIKSEKAAVEFLSGGLVKGLSVGIAKKIVNTYGVDIFSLIERENAIELLTKVPNMNKEKSELLVERIRKEKAKGDLLTYLNDCNVPCIYVNKLITNYGSEAIGKLKRNPYEAGYEVGLDFYTCDLIARKGKKDPYDKERINALVKTALLEQLSNGHCYCSMKMLMSGINYTLKRAAYQNEIPETLIAMALQTNKEFVVEKADAVRIYLKFIWKQEKTVAQQIRRLSRASSPLMFTESCIEIAEKECKVKYAYAQRNAFHVLKSTGIKIITGGPGTGKTTTINGIIHAYRMMYPKNKIALCAPTGRAAQRMTETTNREALTIHKLLDIKPFGKDIISKDNTDPVNADFIIVDEFSMVDITLMSILLNAIDSGTLVLFVGDENQLPSVGPGAVMRDLISSGVVDVYRLKAVFRQVETSPIVSNANKLLKGYTNFIENDEFVVKQVESDIQLKMAIIDYMNKYYKKETPFAVQVLTPSKKGDAGVWKLNEALQNKLNDTSEEIKYGNTTFRKNDKIIMTRNNYATGYFNGDIGQIEELCPNGVVNAIQDDEIEIFNNDMDDMMLAYAMTIHKSQGSEYETVIIAVPENNSGLTMNGLFTALTRAKKKVILIYTNNALINAVRNKKAEWRNTGLKERLLGIEYQVMPKLEIESVRVF